MSKAGATVLDSIGGRFHSMRKGHNNNIKVGDGDELTLILLHVKSLLWFKEEVSALIIIPWSITQSLKDSE